MFYSFLCFLEWYKSVTTKNSYSKNDCGPETTKVLWVTLSVAEREKVSLLFEYTIPCLLRARRTKFFLLNIGDDYACTYVNSWLLSAWFICYSSWFTEMDDKHSLPEDKEAHLLHDSLLALQVSSTTSDWKLLTSTKKLIEWISEQVSINIKR